MSSYRLTVLAGVVVLTLSVGAVALFGAQERVVIYLAFVSPTVVALLALMRTEQNAKDSEVRHADNQRAIVSIQDGQQTIAKEALAVLRESRLSVEDASLIAAQVVHQQEHAQGK